VRSTFSVNEDFFHSVLSPLPGLVCYLDCDLNYKYANLAYEKWFGISREKFLGSNLAEIAGLEVVNSIRYYLNLALAGQEQSFSQEIPYKSGKKFVQVRYIPDIDSKGKVKGIMAIVNDITPHENDKKKIKDKEAEFKRLVNGLPMMISHWDQNLKNIISNDLYSKHFRKSTTEIEGMHLKEVIGDTLFEKNRPYFEAALRGIPQTFENEVLSPDGSIRRFRVTYQPELVNQKIIGLMTIAIDVTHEHEAAFRFEQMANNIEEVFWMTDAKKQEMVYVSPAYEKIWGRTCESLYSHPQSFNDAIHSEDRDRVCSALEAQESEKYDVEYRIVRIDGSIRWIRDRAFPIKSDDGKFCRIVGVAQDITERVADHDKLLGEIAKSNQAAKLASLGEMAACIVHEINNPLAIISGSLNLLPSIAKDSEKVLTRIKTINKACFRISKIVSSLKKFSRSDSNSAFTSHSLYDIANECIILTEAKAKGADTEISLVCESPSQILCGEIEIEQVVVNLINNAIDAVKDLDKKWVKLKITNEAGAVVLRISDSGNGIPKEIQEKLFNPFFTTKPVEKGTGLGLSITKAILDSHKASITLLNDTPHTTFEIRFPTAAGECAA